MDTANAPIFGIDSNGRVNEWNDVSLHAFLSEFFFSESHNYLLLLLIENCRDYRIFPRRSDGKTFS